MFEIKFQNYSRFEYNSNCISASVSRDSVSSYAGRPSVTEKSEEASEAFGSMQVSRNKQPD